jgi:hypothetical protein
MKHDELLGLLQTSYDVKRTSALRTVVELHKPEQNCFDVTCYCADDCQSCHTKYPCSTIQVIEKELIDG